MGNEVSADSLRAIARKAMLDYEIDAAVANELRTALRSAADRIESASSLIRDFTDPDDCWFDHHGGCQAHGYLTLHPGELCPHAEAKRDWLTSGDR